jgi:hypothetical protein
MLEQAKELDKQVGVEINIALPKLKRPVWIIF